MMVAIEFIFVTTLLMEKRNLKIVIQNESLKNLLHRNRFEQSLKKKKGKIKITFILLDSTQFSHLPRHFYR